MGRTQVTMAAITILTLLLARAALALADCNKPDIKAETYHQGNDLRWYGDIKNPEECFKKCKDYFGNHGRFCEGMTYLPSYKWCYLHHTVEDNKIKTGANHFFAKNEKCPSKYPNCFPVVRFDIYHKGNDLLSKTFDSIEECYQVCKDFEQDTGKYCDGVTFKEANKRCYLHSKVEECKLRKGTGHRFAKNGPCEVESVWDEEEITCGDLSCLEPGHTLRKWSGPSEECAKMTKFREFTQAGKDLIVKAHNDFRQKVAAGKETIGNLPEGSNMKKMEWNDELAMTAQRWSDQCTFGHDSNRRMCDGTYAGQNGALGPHRSTVTNDDINAMVGDYVKMWYDEVSRFNASNIEPFKYGGGYGHFSQVVWSGSYMVGCGITTYQKKPDDYWMWSNVMCNYAPGGNVLGAGYPLYKIGKKCSECPEDYVCDETYDALCVYRGW